MTLSIGDGAAAGALLLSAFTLWRQRGLDDLTKRLNELQIHKEESEATSQKRADLFANFVEVGKGSHQFRIHNRGKGTARAIRMDVIEGSSLFQNSDLAAKFPYPALVTHQPINLSVYLHFGSPRRVAVKLIWDDDAGGGEKTITADAF